MTAITWLMCVDSASAYVGGADASSIGVGEARPSSVQRLAKFHDNSVTTQHTATVYFSDPADVCNDDSS